MVSLRAAAAAGALPLLLLGIGGLWLWPPALPPPNETDVMAALLRDVVQPTRAALVVSEPSDCHSRGEAKAALPADLFRRFLDANGTESQAFNLAPLAQASQLPDGPDAGKAAPLLYAATGRPVIALSRAGLEVAEALVCVTVFGDRDRAFFAVLARGHDSGWALAREVLAWESESLGGVVPAPSDEPLFLPRPSALDRALREQ